MKTMPMKLERNGLARVPSRAKLVPTVTPWRPKNRPMPASQSRCDKLREHESEAVALLATADDPPAVTLAPATVPVPSEPASRDEAGWLARYRREWVPWCCADAALIHWFQSKRDRLPIEPFNLKPGIRVFDPPKFFRSLDSDIQAGSNSPRAVGLLDDLKWLRNLMFVA